MVLDQLNTHSRVFTYEAFEPKEADRCEPKRIGYHTPEHGSWSNAVETEFAALSKQVQTAQRRLNPATKRGAGYFETEFLLDAQVNWQFTTTAARISWLGLPGMFVDNLRGLTCQNHRVVSGCCRRA